MLIALVPTGGGSAYKSGARGMLNVYLQPPAPLVISTAAKQQESLPPLPPASPKSAADSTGNGYLLPHEVDVRARPVSLPVLIYPEQAYQMRTRGMVRLRIYINETGKIDAVDVVAANPPGVFEDAALQALLSTTYIPAKKNGRTVKSQKLIEVKFDPYETASPP